jgi:RNA polymerase sigma-70 factor, ECF subfamily
VNPQTRPAERFEVVVAEVYEPLQRYLLRRVPRDDVADLLNEVLLIMWRRRDQLPPDQVLPWSYGVARRVVANHRRGTERRLRLVRRLESEPVPMAHGRDADDPRLAEALGALPAADREILRLWAWEQLEPREMALVLGTSANAASLRLGRAKKKLSERLARQDPSAAGHIGVDTPRSNDHDG